jgi:DnaJ-class molecular chaperone
MASGSSRKKKTCTDCNGNGWTVPADALKPGTPDNVTCTTCDGDGFVYVD